VDEVLLMAARLLVSSVFFMAGWIKIREGSAFASTVRNFHLLPESFIPAFAVVLPWLELSVGIALFVGFYVQFAALLALVMSASFLFASILAMRKHLNLQCNCFGLLYRERIGPSTVIRDALLVLACLCLAIFDGSPFLLDRVTSGKSPLTEFLVLLSTVVTLLISAVLAYRAGGGLPWPSRRPEQQPLH
jgi:uncharacterized membrane protein YphA (DoxX/SURF4 family)